MNCLDFRRLCLVEPENREPRIYLHLYHCPACRAYRKRVLLAEQEMKSAMLVPVPEGLGSKVVFDSEMQSQSLPATGRWKLAFASLIMVVALGVGFNIYNSGLNVVPVLAMHIADDPLHMTPAQADARMRLDMVLRHLGGTWDGVKPAITHATVCLIRERAAAHLVVNGEKGPVTVFLIPKFDASERQGEKVDGQIATVIRLEQGSMALFGYEGENFDAIASVFHAGVKWSAPVAQLPEKIILAGK